MMKKKKVKRKPFKYITHIYTRDIHINISLSLIKRYIYVHRRREIHFININKLSNIL